MYNNTANVWTSSAGVSAVGGVTAASVAGGVITGSSVSVTGNVSGGNLIATTFIGNYSGTTASITGNIDGGNLRTAGLVSATGSITGAAITGTSLTVTTGNITGGNIVNGNGNGIGNIGSSTVFFNTVFAKATSAQYADLAEKYESDAEYAPGTVLEFGGDKEVTLSVEAGSTRVAGVVSTNPSYIMNAGLTAEHVAMVALQGRVPCRVVGTVRKGDMMVAAGNGAARVDNSARAGSIIGNSSLSNRAELEQALTQMSQPDPQQAQMQQMALQMDMQQKEATTQSLQARAQRDSAEAAKTVVETQLMPEELRAKVISSLSTNIDGKNQESEFAKRAKIAELMLKEADELGSLNFLH